MRSAGNRKISYFKIFVLCAISLLAWQDCGPRYGSNDFVNNPANSNEDPTDGGNNSLGGGLTIRPDGITFYDSLSVNEGISVSQFEVVPADQHRSCALDFQLSSDIGSTQRSGIILFVNGEHLGVISPFSGSTDAFTGRISKSCTDLVASSFLPIPGESYQVQIAYYLDNEVSKKSDIYTYIHPTESYVESFVASLSQGPDNFGVDLYNLQPPGGFIRDQDECRFNFTIRNVPTTESSYGIILRVNGELHGFHIIGESRPSEPVVNSSFYCSTFTDPQFVPVVGEIYDVQIAYFSDGRISKYSEVFQYTHLEYNP